MRPSIVHLGLGIRYGGGQRGYLFALQQALAEATCRARSEIGISEVAFAYRHPRELHELCGRAVQKIGRAWFYLGRKEPQISRYIHYLMDGRRREARHWARANFTKLRCYRLVVAHDVFVASALMEVDKKWCNEHLCVMTHNPSFIVREIAGMVDEQSDSPEGCERLIRRFTIWEEEMMNCARAVIWPCAESMESFQSAGEIGLSSVNAEFVMTGVPRPTTCREPQELRAEWGVRPGQKVILFLGRPHPHKGFGVFEELARLAKAAGREDLTFLWGGDKLRTEKPTVARHIGWVTDNGAALRAADLNLVPNMVTYMDIGVLQALSLGAPMLISNRGGNKAVAARAVGLPTFEPEANASTLEMIDRAISAFSASDDLRTRLVSAWRRHFSPSAFVRNHLRLTGRLLG